MKKHGKKLSNLGDPIDLYLPGPTYIFTVFFPQSVCYQSRIKKWSGKVGTTTTMKFYGLSFSVPSETMMSLLLPGLHRAKILKLGFSFFSYGLWKTPESDDPFGGI